MIRSSQYRDAGRAVFEQLRNADVGAVQDLPDEFSDGGTLDSTGNLEAIPPYTNGDESYPAGRVIQGVWDNWGERPRMLSFLGAQETQNPLELDTSWLMVGHVDEFMQFLPANNKRGFVLMIDDPMAGLALLQDASAAGYGNVTALSRQDRPSDYPEYCIPQDTLDEILAFDGLIAENKRAAARIDGNLQILKHEIGLTDDEIFRVPGMFYSGWWECPWDDDWEDDEWDVVESDEEGSEIQRLKGPRPHGNSGKNGKKNIIEAVGRTRKAKLMRRQGDDEENAMAAFFPGIVNGIVLPNNIVLGPNPWGPIIEGVDIIAQAAVESYAQAGANLTFMDDYWSHHVLLGEVHCGTNSWREMDAPWW